MMKNYLQRAMLQHWFNPMHIFCRLRDIGVPIVWAKKVCIRYEKLTHSVLYEPASTH